MGYHYKLDQEPACAQLEYACTRNMNIRDHQHGKKQPDSDTVGDEG